MTMKRSPENERIKRRYLQFLGDVKGRDEASLDAVRDRAIVSFKSKHIDLERELLEQDAREVRTKHAKTFTTWFFPVGDAIQQIVVDWVAFLRSEKGFDSEDPLFPKSRVETGADRRFVASGLNRAHWANAHPVRANFKEAFRRGDCLILIRTHFATRSFNSPMS